MDSTLGVCRCVVHKQDSSDHQRDYCMGPSLNINLSSNSSSKHATVRAGCRMMRVYVSR